MLKPTQVFSIDQEPAWERPSEFAHSGLWRHAEPSVFAALKPMVVAGDRRAKNDSTLPPEARRSPPNPADARLSKLALPWVENLPPKALPFYLCEHFPRIVNRLALCWADHALSLRILDDLLKDRRGGRRGFPPEALREIKSLREVAADRRKAVLKIVP